MKTSALLARVAAIAVVLFVFGVAVYRAKTQAIAHDEALAYRFFLDGSVYHLLAFDTNNHLLFTFAAKIFLKIFGISELALRAPSLIATAAYLAATYLLCRKLFGEGMTMLVTFAMLNLNPQVMDFMPSARGYIAGLACLAIGMYFLARLGERGTFDPNNRAWLWDARLASIFLTLSVVSTMSYVFALASLGISFSLVALLGSSSFRQSPRETLRLFARNFVLPGAAVGLFIFWPYMIQMRPYQFNLALHRASDSLRDIFSASFLYKWTDDIYAPSLGALAPTPGSWQERAISAGSFLVLPALFLLVAAGVMLARRQAVTSLSATDARQCQIFAGGAIACVLLTIGLHFTLKVNYPFSRYCLYIIPLFAIGAVLAGRQISSRWPSAALKAAGFLLAAVVILDYGLSVNTRYIRYNAYDVISLDLYRAIENEARSHGLNNVRVGGTWWFEPEINFYRQRYGATWMQEYEVKDKSYWWNTPNSLTPADYDYFVFVPESDPGLSGPRVRTIYHDARTQATIIAIAHGADAQH